MSSIVLLLVINSITNIINAQSFNYENDILIDENEIFKGGCSPNSSTYNIYRTKEYWIPNTNTVEKIIPINIHIFQKDDGSNNWQNSTTDINLLNWLFEQASEIYVNNCIPSDPVAGVNEVTSSKIKLVIKDIFFIKMMLLILPLMYIQ